MVGAKLGTIEEMIEVDTCRGRKPSSVIIAIRRDTSTKFVNPLKIMKMIILNPKVMAHGYARQSSGPSSSKK